MVLGLYQPKDEGYLQPFPAQIPNCWSSELPTIDLYIDQRRTVTGVSTRHSDSHWCMMLNAYSDFTPVLILTNNK